MEDATEVTELEDIATRQLVVRVAQASALDFRDKLATQGLTKETAESLKSTAAHLARGSQLYSQFDALRGPDLKYSGIGYDQLDEFGFRWGMIQFKDNWKDRVLKESKVAQGHNKVAFKEYKSRFETAIRCCRLVPRLFNAATSFQGLTEVMARHRKIPGDNDGEGPTTFRVAKKYALPPTQFETLSGRPRNIAKGDAGEDGCVVHSVPKSVGETMSKGKKEAWELDYFKRRPSSVRVFFMDSPSDDYDLLPQLPKTIIKTASLCQIFGLTTMRSVCTNGLEWIWIVYTLEEGIHRVWTSEPLQVHEPGKHGVLQNLKAMLALLEHWFVNAKEIDSEKLFTRRDA